MFKTWKYLENTFNPELSFSGENVGVDQQLLKWRMIPFHTSQIHEHCHQLKNGDIRIIYYYKKGTSVARGIKKKYLILKKEKYTEGKKTYTWKTFFGLCYPQGTRGFPKKIIQFCPNCCPAIANIHIYTNIIIRLLLFCRFLCIFHKVQSWND